MEDRDVAQGMLKVNKHGAELLLEGLNLLPVTKKDNVVYNSIVKDLKMILMLYERRIKMTKTVYDEKRKRKKEKN